MIEFLPTFKAEDFLFKGPEPLHHDAEPGEPINDEYFRLWSDPPHVEPVRCIAVDIPNMELCKYLLTARILKEQLTVKAYGYADDLYIGLPDGSNQLVYMGWRFHY